MTEQWYWPDIREQAIDHFGGELPHPQTEAEIVEVFEQRPRAVLEAISRVAVDKRTGSSIRSAWSVLRSRLLQAGAPAAEVTASDDSERERRIANAERWIVHTGVHYDRQDELEDELFGAGGMLRAWADDELLRRRLVDRWKDERPRGERAELEELERAEHWKETRAQVEHVLRTKRQAKAGPKPVPEREATPA